MNCIGNKKVYLWLLFLILLLTLSNITITVGISDNTKASNRWYDISFTPSNIPTLNGNYTWIWEEYENAPGNIYTDDIVFWGPNFGPYHNYEETTAKILSLENNFPEYVDVFSIGKSTYGREIWTVKITNESSTNPKYEFYLVAEHHAREAITLENALYFIDKLIYSALIEKNSTIIELLNNAEIYIVPLLNPDGHSILWWYPIQRKNLRMVDEDRDGTVEDEFEVRYVWDEKSNQTVIVKEDSDDPDTIVGEDLPGGVDLNRNYNYQWYGTGSSTDESSEVYRGPYPASEPEVQALIKFMYQHDFRYALSLHSGIQAIIKPWGYTSDEPPHNDELVAVQNVLKNITGFPTWEEIGGYYVNGEWGDWCLGKRDILSYTIEVYGGASYESIWDFFNPPANKVIKNSDLIYNATVYLATNPHIKEVNTLPTIKDIQVSIINTTHINITWNANDGDGDSLEYKIYLGKKNSWFVAKSGLKETSAIVDLSSLSIRNGQYRIKVVAYDGTDRVLNYANTTIDVVIPTIGKLDLTTNSNQTVVYITLDDDDINLHDEVTETVQVMISSTADPTGFFVTLVETTPSSGIFEGSVTLSNITKSGTLLVNNQDNVTVTYNDETTETGPYIVTESIAINYGRSTTTTTTTITSSTTSSSTSNTTTTTETTTTTDHARIQIIVFMGILVAIPIVAKFTKISKGKERVR